MISISKEVRQAEQREKERRELLGFYSAALQLSGKHELDTPGRETYVAELRRLCEGISRDSSLEALQQSVDEFERCLVDYCASLEKSISQGLPGGATEIRTVLALLKDAAGTLESSNVRISAKVKEFTHQLEETLDCPDIATTRALLSDHVRRMKEWAETLSSESAVQLVAFEKQLRSYEQRLKEVESTAAMDPLTGVWNRREAERRLQESIDRGMPFSLIVVDLNKFKTINDRYGHRCGDRVLQQVADRLRTSVRPRDHVGRWGGDEFVVIMELGNPIGERRAAELADQLRGIASFEFEGQQVSVEMSASVGWARYERGETAASLFHRADLDMYRRKRLAELEAEKAVVFAL
jgi:diguanylate cyclase (GGDEF)-like protein